MSSFPASTRVNVISCLRYRDAPTAIEWLCHARDVRWWQRRAAEDAGAGHRMAGLYQRPGREYPGRDASRYGRGMNDEQAIRGLIERWLAATRDGIVVAVLELMAPDVVFLQPGQRPMEGARLSGAACAARWTRTRSNRSARSMRFQSAGIWRTAARGSR